LSKLRQTIESQIKQLETKDNKSEYEISELSLLKSQYEEE